MPDEVIRGNGIALSLRQFRALLDNLADIKRDIYDME
jgi:hypothetical protein